MNRNLRWTAMTFALIATTFVLAQGPPPRGGPGQPPPSQASTNSRGPGAQQSRSSASVPSTTITLLSRTDVQKDLGMTVEQYNQLSRIAQAISGQVVSEDFVRTTVDRVLSAGQAKRLTELTIQYVGYGALGLTDVRSKLKLFAEQEARASEILTSLAQSKRTLQNSNSQKVAELQSQANAHLAKILTADQDKALRAMAGQPL